jgi:hypothetical protein
VISVDDLDDLLGLAESALTGDALRSGYAKEPSGADGSYRATSCRTR